MVSPSKDAREAAAVALDVAEALGVSPKRLCSAILERASVPPVARSCTACNGSGFQEWQGRDCSHCWGTGSVSLDWWRVEREMPF